MTAVTRLSEVVVPSLEGRMLGEFRLVREIACGGMATVYLAQKTGAAGISQPAALKVIHPHLARDNDFVDMFLDEARIVSCISHPNVSRVLDFGQADGTYYLAMEYVMGETWADTLSALKATPEARGIMPALLSQVLAQACEGLHAAHEACGEDGSPLRIVHRDVSPQNLIIGYDGSVRVLDFGIASATEKLHTTRNGTIKGRFAYMSPEQMRGHIVDRRADIWSLGVVLWEGLARERLFKRETEAETVLAVTSDPLPSLEGRKLPVPTTLNKVAMQALSRDREQRFATAREFGLELSRFASGGLVQVGMPEVSLWMHRLFAERIAQKRALLRYSAKAANRAVTVSSAPPPAPSEPTSQHSQSRSTTSVVASLSARATMPSISVVREVTKKKPWRKNAVRVAVAALVSATLFAWLHARDAAPAMPQYQRSTKQLAAAKPAPTAPELAPPEPAPALAVLVEAPSLPNTSPAQPVAEAPSEALDDKLIAMPDAPAADEPSDVQPAVDDQETLEESDPQPSTRNHAVAQRRSTRAAKRAKEEVPLDLVAVNIVTPGGWADVFLKGVWLGTTPARIELPAGRHVLSLRPFGDGEELVRKIDLTKGNPLKLKVSVD